MRRRRRRGRPRGFIHQSRSAEASHLGGERSPRCLGIRRLRLCGAAIETSHEHFEQCLPSWITFAQPLCAHEFLRRARTCQIAIEQFEVERVSWHLGTFETVVTEYNTREAEKPHPRF